MPWYRLERKNPNTGEWEPVGECAVLRSDMERVKEYRSALNPDIKYRVQPFEP